MLKSFIIRLIIFSFFTVSFFGSCKKNSSSPDGTVLEKYFESSVLNKNIIVNYASNNGTDITANYNGYTFVLLKTDYYHGPLQAKKDATVITGSWSTNDDYSKLTITLPALPQEFVFLSRSWRFTSKTTTLMKLAPWGSSEPLVLYMQLQ